MATADDNTTTAKPERERGTLNETLPRRPIIIVAIVVAASAALATALFAYSSPTPTAINDVADLGFIASLGAASTAVGIIFGDSISHAFAFGLVLLVAGRSDIKSSIIAASPPLIFTALASVKAPRSIISSLDSGILPTPMILQACCLLPLLTLVHQSSLNPEYLSISIVPSCTVIVMTLLMMRGYSTNRSHKNGYLLTTEMKSQAAFAGISILLSCSIMESNLDESTTIIVIFLLGSLFMLLMSFIFAFVGDNWYVVGSGQWQMCSLDTAGMMAYVGAPAVILYLRFLDKYGEFVGSKAAVVKEYLQSSGVLSKGDVYGEDAISFSLVLTLAMITAVGVPLLNALSPIGGYLFSRAYTHGQPNTKKVALCIKFSDLPLGTANMADIWSSLEKKKGVLNIYVTLEELYAHTSYLKAIASKGHAVALAPTDFGETLNGLSLFQGNTASCQLQIAQHEYSEAFEKIPLWMLAKSSDSIGRHPSLLRQASDLGMKVAYWSTLLELSGAHLTKKQQSGVKGDCADKNGGSIIYATLQKGVPSSMFSPLICEVIGLLDGFQLEPLSDVAKDDLKMSL